MPAPYIIHTLIFLDWTRVYSQSPYISFSLFQSFIHNPTVLTTTCSPLQPGFESLHCCTFHHCHYIVCYYTTAIFLPSVHYLLYSDQIDDSFVRPTKIKKANFKYTLTEFMDLITLVSPFTKLSYLKMQLYLVRDINL